MTTPQQLAQALSLLQPGTEAYNQVLKELNKASAPEKTEEQKKKETENIESWWPGR